MAKMDNKGEINNKWLEIENEFWQRNKRKTEAIDSEYRPIYESLIAKLRTFAMDKHLDENQYDLELEKAGKIIEDITYAMKAYWENSPSHRIWCYPEARWSGRPEKWTASSPVDALSLDRATAKYLENPWMQLNNIDWYIINAFVFSELSSLSEGIVSGQVFGTINWAYVFAGGRIDKAIIYQLTFSVAKFVLQWLLLPAIGILLYYKDFIKLATWVFVAYAVYIAFRVILFPKRFFERKELKKQHDKMEGVLKSVTQIYLNSNSETINPAQLRALMADAEKKGIPLKPAVYAILDRAIQRDPAVMTKNQ
jgi:hypothetical protein